MNILNNHPYKRKSFRNSEMIITIIFDGDGWGRIIHTNLIKQRKFNHLCIFVKDIYKFTENLPDDPNIRDVLRIMPEATYYVGRPSSWFNDRLAFPILNGLIELPQTVSHPVKKMSK